MLMVMVATAIVFVNVGIIARSLDNQADRPHCHHGEDRDSTEQHR